MDNNEEVNPVVPETSAGKDIVQEEPAMGSSSGAEEPHYPRLDYQTVISTCEQKLSKLEGMAKELEVHLYEAMQIISKISFTLEQSIRSIE